MAKYRRYTIPATYNSCLYHRQNPYRTIQLTLICYAHNATEAATMFEVSIGYLRKYGHISETVPDKLFDGVWATTDRYPYPTLSEEPHPLEYVKNFIDLHLPRE